MTLGSPSAKYNVGTHAHGFLVFIDLNLIYFLYFRIFIIITKDFVILISLFAHHGSTNLAQSDAMAPTTTLKFESRRNGGAWS